MASDFYDKIVPNEEGFGHSKINAAGLINLSLENLWVQVYRAQSNCNLAVCNRHLDSIWLILGGDLPANDNKVKQYKEIDKAIGKTGNLSHVHNSFGIVSQDELKIIAVQYRLIMEKALFLRRLQNKQGKGTAYEESIEDYMD